MLFQVLAQFMTKSPKCRMAASSSLSGIVTEVGALVTRCAVGDRIAGFYHHVKLLGAC